MGTRIDHNGTRRSRRETIISKPLNYPTRSSRGASGPPEGFQVGSWSFSGVSEYQGTGGLSKGASSKGGGDTMDIIHALRAKNWNQTFR